jgi:hypothetical protein
MPASGRVSVGQRSAASSAMPSTPTAAPVDPTNHSGI